LHLLLAESTVNNHFDYNYDQCFGLKEEGYCDDHYVFWNYYNLKSNLCASDYLLVIFLKEL